MELIRSKCIPILICGLECFALIYEIVRQRALMLLKLANLSLALRFLYSCVLKRKTDKFILRFNCVENAFFAIFVAQFNVSVEYFISVVKLD